MADDQCGVIGADGLHRAGGQSMKIGSGLRWQMVKAADGKKFEMGQYGRCLAWQMVKICN